MTAAELDAVVLAIAPVIREFVAAELASRDAEIVRLKSLTGTVGPVGPGGEQGPAGRDGADGKDGVDGKDGAHGMDGEPGKPGSDGKDGAAGRDGVGISDALISQDGHLVLTLSDGTVKTVGIVVGKDGAAGANGKDGANGLDGKDGADGLGFDDMDVTFDGERTVTQRYVRGERVKEFPMVFPTTIYRGVWENEKQYERGDQVSCDGSTWTALTANKSIRPGVAAAPSRCWQLSSKKGLDGKQGREGKQGPIGPKGDRGEMGPKGY